MLNFFEILQQSLTRKTASALVIRLTTAQTVTQGNGIDVLYMSLRTLLKTSNAHLRSLACCLPLFLSFTGRFLFLLFSYSRISFYVSFHVSLTWHSSLGETSGNCTLVPKWPIPEQWKNTPILHKHFNFVQHNTPKRPYIVIRIASVLLLLYLLGKDLRYTSVRVQYYLMVAAFKSLPCIMKHNKWITVCINK